MSKNNSRSICFQQLTKSRWFDLAFRFIRFCLVGTTGVLIDMNVLFLLADPRMAAWPVLISKVVAAEVAMINNFTWNDLWTFRGCSQSTVLRRYLKFNLICSVGLFISVMVLILGHRIIGMNLYSANLLAIGTATAWNFLMNRKFAWSKT